MLRGALFGLGAGIAAGLLMNQVHTVWSRGLLAYGVRNASGGSGDPATRSAAEAIAGPLPPGARQIGGSIMHYAMAGGLGALYGALRELAPAVGGARGVAYGALVWLVADEVAVPALGLAPARMPLAIHARALLAHLAYGAALDAGVRALARRAARG